MKNKAVKFGIVAAVFPHIFCCGLPIALSLVGLIAPEAAHIQILPHWLEPWLFVISGLILALSWVMIIQDCHCACDACHGAHSHRVQKIIMSVVTVLFIIGLILHVVTH